MEEIEKYVLKKIGQLRYNNVEVLFDSDANKYYCEVLGRKKRKGGGFIDIDSYFEDPKEKIFILIFNSQSKYVYGTIAHEFEHAQQLLDKLILPNTHKGKFMCELQAYYVGKEELKKHNKFVSLKYCLWSLDGIICSLWKYVIKPKFSTGKTKK